MIRYETGRDLLVFISELGSTDRPFVEGSYELVEQVITLHDFLLSLHKRLIVGQYNYYMTWNQYWLVVDKMDDFEESRRTHTSLYRRLLTEFTTLQNVTHVLHEEYEYIMNHIR